MEWNDKQVNFLKDNEKLIEEKKWAELWDLSGISDYSLDREERKHLFLGIAVIANLPIKLEITVQADGDQKAIMALYLGSYFDRITILRGYFSRKDSVSEILETFKSYLKPNYGCSYDLIKKIINQVEVVKE